MAASDPSSQTAWKEAGDHSLSSEGPALNRRFWIKLGLFFFLTLVSALAIAEVQLVRGPTEPLADYMADNGFVLDVTQMLLRGKVLYQDIFWQYGPIPIQLYRELAAVLGNSPDTYLSFGFMWSVPATFLIYIVVRRRLPLGYTLLFLAMLFYALNPLSKQIIYEKFELIFLLLAALIWRPLEERGRWCCVGLGLLVGLLQFCKFGPHVVLAVTLLAIDILQWAQRRFAADTLRLVFQKNALTWASYLAVLALGTIWLASHLSRPVVADVLWPGFMQGGYSYVTDQTRYPHFLNLGYFIGVQGPALAGLGACLLAMIHVLRSSSPSARKAKAEASFPYELMICPLFYLIAIPLIFRHTYHYYQYAVIAALGIPLFYSLLGKKFRPRLALLFIPYLLLIPLGWIKSYRQQMHSPALINWPVMDNRDGVHVSLIGTQDEVYFYQAYIGSLIRKTGPVTWDLIAPTCLIESPGLYYFSSLNTAGRHAWLLPNWVRPWEEQALAAHLAQASAAALSFTSPPASPPSAHDLDLALSTLPENIRKGFIARLTDPVYVGINPVIRTSIWVYSVRK